MKRSVNVKIKKIHWDQDVIWNGIKENIRSSIQAENNKRGYLKEAKIMGAQIFHVKPGFKCLFFQSRKMDIQRRLSNQEVLS